MLFLPRRQLISCRVIANLALHHPIWTARFLETGLFFFFNQPTYFEEWVTNTKRQIFPPENMKDREAIQQLIKDMRKKQMEALEKE
ncbi:unnamed protein product [Spodoptera littoralis]|uniref:Uncharacterized protein n=1 Tax=Spodoptera littoralis TaxID=7109 RepID=A0A9P0NA54_SPOLI|nr:unnamed protein product [Spodoptera littoralis]